MQSAPQAPIAASPGQDRQEQGNPRSHRGQQGQEQHGPCRRRDPEEELAPVCDHHDHACQKEQVRRAQGAGCRACPLSEPGCATGGMPEGTARPEDWGEKKERQADREEGVVDLRESAVSADPAGVKGICRLRMKVRPCLWPGFRQLTP